ncbi:hypothetical protein B0H16DRAFT_1455306 [Mycena metata]|uniref:Uncharacterized protein n=1 Tax=Mycena metata TaxID=1033252 RepID=A0AAD7NJY2_9AGAR|nr:hypothetical protein B0H16DRAFT_1455306 [Mycena metata]
MQSFWSSPYQPVAQEEKLSDSGSALDLLQHNETQSRREKWLGRVVLCIAAANVLIALATVIVTRDISKLRIPLAGVDVSALPRPNPVIPRNVFAEFDVHHSVSNPDRASRYFKLPQGTTCYLIYQGENTMFAVASPRKSDAQRFNLHPLQS